MKRSPVKSSNLKSVGFEKPSKSLEIEFKSGGLYQFSGIHPNTHRFLMAAPSKGKFFHKNIRGQYPFKKL